MNAASRPALGSKAAEKSNDLPFAPGTFDLHARSVIRRRPTPPQRQRRYPSALNQPRTQSRQSRRALFHRDRESTEIYVRQQPDLPSGQFQHRALLVGQHDRAGAGAYRKPRARSAVDARHIRRPRDVAHGPVQHGLRAAEDKAIVQPTRRQRVSPAAEVEDAAATGTADDPPRLVDRESHGADVSKAGGGQANEHKKRDQRGTNGRCNLHETTLLVRVKAERITKGVS